MTLREVADTLPNGFHDAELNSLKVDYVRRVLTLELCVWIGLMSNVQARELYRPCRLTLNKLAFFVIEPPTFSYAWNDPGPIVIDMDEGYSAECDTKVPEAPEELDGTFQWNHQHFEDFVAVLRVNTKE